MPPGIADAAVQMGIKGIPGHFRQAYFDGFIDGKVLACQGDQVFIDRIML